MMLIPCPWCGPRDESEFHYGGQAGVAYPADPGALSDAEWAEAERHLMGCEYCARRYKFEEHLRRYVKLSAAERMPPGLMAKLQELRGLDATA